MMDTAGNLLLNCSCTILHPFSWLDHADHDDHGDPHSLNHHKLYKSRRLEVCRKAACRRNSRRTCSLPREVKNAPTQHRTTNLGTNSREFAISSISSITSENHKSICLKNRIEKRERERQSVPARLSRGTSNRTYTVLDCSHCSHFMTAWLHPIEIFHPNVHELKNSPRILTSFKDTSSVTSQDWDPWLHQCSPTTKETHLPKEPMGITIVG